MNEFAKPNLAVSQIPSSSVADAGKALVVGEDGVPVWGNGGGSGGGSGGGGVELVNVTFASSAGTYLINIHSAYIVDGSTYLSGGFDVSDLATVTIGIPKFGAGPVIIPLGNGGLITTVNVDENVLPQVSGDATLDMNTGDWIINGDCTFTAAGLVEPNNKENTT